MLGGKDAVAGRKPEVKEGNVPRQCHLSDDMMGKGTICIMECPLVTMARVSFALSLRVGGRCSLPLERGGRESSNDCDW